MDELQVKSEYKIAYDRGASTEMDAKYFVYDDENFVHFMGTYTQCLVVIGGFTQGLNLKEIRDKTNGYI